MEYQSHSIHCSPLFSVFCAQFYQVEKFLDNPGDKDVTVDKVFTPEMFEKLDKRLTDVGWKSVKSYWDNDFSKRTIVAGFMKDDTLGSKRLASMPDRITNTINTADGKTVFRPTVINMVRYLSILACTLLFRAFGLLIASRLLASSLPLPPTVRRRP
jgi:hypothetical protein